MSIQVKLTTMALVWAGGFVINKMIAHQAGPFTIAFFRFLIASIALGLLVRWNESHTKINMRVFLYAIAAAFFGVFLYQYIFLLAITTVDAGRSSVIMSLVPIVVMIVSFTFFKEKASVLKIIGTVFSLLGAVVVISRGNVLSVVQGSVGLGEYYMVLSVLCAVAFAFFSKEILKTLEPVITMFYVAAIGAVFLLGPAVMEMQTVSVDVWSRTFVPGIFYLALGPSVVSVVFYYEGIKKQGAAYAAQYMNLIPLFSVVLAFVFLGEQISLSLLLGGSLVLFGIYLTSINLRKV